MMRRSAPTVPAPDRTMKGILGKKVGMTQVFDRSGRIVPVTIIEAGPCIVTQRKTTGRDGYSAIQLGFEEVPARKLNRPRMGHLRRNNLPPLRFLRELRVRETEEYEVGQKLLADVFAEGDQVDVVGKTKGKGFAGAMKRHGFAGGPMTHGQSDRSRTTGSVGACKTPGRVFKGKRMPGRMGNARFTAQTLRVVLVDKERNLLAVKGPVPGPKGGLLIIKEARKQA
jgi:large subunit ribosomal protein L3